MIRTARALLRTLALGLTLAGAAACAQAQTDSAPTWASLTPAQKQALAPLQREWATIDANRKQKWIEVAGRFPTLPAEERERIRDRMAAWAALSPAERARARQQFQEARQIPAEDRKSRWEAYRALPEEERRQLAAQAKPAQGARPSGSPAAGAAAGRTAGATGANRSGVRAERESVTAIAAKRNVVTPTTTQRPRPVAPTVVQARPGATTMTMAQTPSPPAHHQPGLPKIVATPGFVDPATLLPQRGPQGAAMRSAAVAPADPSREQP